MNNHKLEQSQTWTNINMNKHKQTGSERQMHLFDPRKLGEKIAVVKVDASPSSLLPFYDEDTQLLYTAGKVQ